MVFAESRSEKLGTYSQVSIKRASLLKISKSTCIKKNCEMSSNTRHLSQRNGTKVTLFGNCKNIEIGTNQMSSSKSNEFGIGCVMCQGKLGRSSSRSRD